MTEEQLTLLLEGFLSLPAENEVVEFKKAENGFDTQKLGEYFSALSNEANLGKKGFGWLLFGIDDKTHSAVGSQYKSTRKTLDALKREIAEGINGGITFIEIYELYYQHKRVVMFQIPAAPKGIPISYKGHYYGRDGESLVALNIHELETIRNQVKQFDWSAQLVKGDSYYCDLILKALAEHGILTKQEITKLLWKKLPDVLDENQKQNKIGNLLSKLRRLDKIENDSRGIHSNWQLKKDT